MIKIKKILCPTDLTPQHDEALRYAVALACEYGARLFLLHCADPAAAQSKGERRESFARRAQRRFEEMLARNVGPTDYAKLEWEGSVACDDDAGRAITREAAERRCDLIVMRARCRPRAAALLGSTAETVCRTAPCAVLVTHAGRRELADLSDGEIGLLRVLVAHDFSDSSELGLQYGLSLARRFGAELHLLHVLSEDVAQGQTWLPCCGQVEYHVAVRDLLNAASCEADPPRELKAVVFTGRPYERVLSYAAENNIDLVCMGSDGVDRGAHTLFGSNVDRVLRQASCAVLVARPFKPSTRDAREDLSELVSAR